MAERSINPRTLLIFVGLASLAIVWWAISAVLGTFLYDRLFGLLADWIGTSSARVSADLGARFAVPLLVAAATLCVVFQLARLYYASGPQAVGTGDGFRLPNSMIPIDEAATRVFEETDASDIVGILGPNERDRLEYHAEQLKMYAEDGEFRLFGRKLPSKKMIEIPLAALKHGTFTIPYGILATHNHGEFHSLAIRRSDLRKAIRLVKAALLDFEASKTTSQGPHHIGGDSSQWTGRRP